MSPRPPVDVHALQVAVRRRAADEIVAVIDRGVVGDALQQIGTAAYVVLELDPPRGADLVADLVPRLTERGWDGDAELAQDLAAAAGGPPTGRIARPVDLEDAAMIMHNTGMMMGEPGGYINRDTGEAVSTDSADADMVGEEYAIDLEDGDWVRLAVDDSRAAWRDMRDFGERQVDARVRDRLLQAIEGRGAFRRFRDRIFDTQLEGTWNVFSEDRAQGRVRAFLATESISPRPGRDG